MRIAHTSALLAVVAALSIVASFERGTAAEPRVVQIEVGDNMKFVPAAITAAPGEPLKVVIKHVGQLPKVAMGHNFVLLKKGVDAKKLVEACASARETEFIVDSIKPQLLAYTRLVGPGETADTAFTAPAARGDYMFVCTFPGHFAIGMKGILTVR